MKFLDVKTDFAFKKVFGSEDSKERLISFLNAVIEFCDGSKIKDLQIVDPYNIPLLKGMKDTYVDVKAILDNGSKVIIEMQVLNHPGFEKRVLYNAAKNYSMQLLKNNQYHLLNPIIALTIVNFVMFEDIKQVISRFKLLEKEQFINYTDDLEMIFIELPKFDKELSDLANITDQWIYFIKNAGSLEYIPNDLPEPIYSAFEASNTAGLSVEELEMQRKREEFIYIQNASLAFAAEKAEKRGKAIGEARGQAIGEKIGEARGMEKGWHNAQIQMVQNMLKAGAKLAFIEEISNLTKEEIKEIEKSIR